MSSPIRISLEWFQMIMYILIKTIFLIRLYLFIFIFDKEHCTLNLLFTLHGIDFYNEGICECSAAELRAFSFLHFQCC